MNESPINATIGFIIDILGLRPENFDGAIETPAVISDVPGISDINVPEGGYQIFPLPPTNPGYRPPSFLPGFGTPSEPIDPNDRNQNGIPDDIDDLLSGR